MKRLVICCDGTWNRPDSQSITNVEKIARTVQSDPDATADVHQLVYYIGGVGTGGYKADNYLGGAFGFGLFRNVIAGYRFLAQNYEWHDEIVIIGFSRGAYTARSLAGMIGRVGLLTRKALVEERLPMAVHLYQRTNLPEGAAGAGVGEFKRDHCHPSVPIGFLGVFDTVGALGVPGLNKLTPEFHDVELGEHVRCARQALAIDETRLKFAPTLWKAPKSPTGRPTEDARVKQVWFEGAHSDVGGGYPYSETGLSDTSLLWMAREAHATGLVFDVSLLNHYVNSGSDPVRHDPLSLVYRADNLILRKKMASGATGPGDGADSFRAGLRRLTTDRALSVRIASSAVSHYREGKDGGYQPANLIDFEVETRGFDGIIEPVLPLPENDLDISVLGRPPTATGLGV